jgi:hypothetical protein
MAMSAPHGDTIATIQDRLWVLQTIASSDSSIVPASTSFASPHSVLRHAGKGVIR